MHSLLDNYVKVTRCFISIIIFIFKAIFLLVESSGIIKGIIEMAGGEILIIALKYKHVCIHIIVKFCSRMKTNTCISWKLSKNRYILCIYLQKNNFFMLPTRYSWTVMEKRNELKSYLRADWIVLCDQDVCPAEKKREKMSILVWRDVILRNSINCETTYISYF